MNLRALALWAVPALALAGDPPHNSYTTSTWDCSQCHTPHRATGGQLTNQANNVLVCNTCHTNQGTTAFGFPWLTKDQAAPDVSGRSHVWDASPSNTTYGSQTPTNPAMAKRLYSGHFMCSTCHDEHNGASLNGGTQHISTVTTVAGGATGSMSVYAAPAATPPRGYLIKIVTTGATGTSTFQLSHDAGASWYGWSAGTSTWVAGLATGKPTGANVELDDPGVRVAFTGSQTFGDQWKFYISYPFLRIANASSQICEDCHAPRVQSSAYIETGGDGVKVFSHPVGEALARSYDRATILDANGGAQGSGSADALKTNDLVLDGSNTVRCMTCHHPHNADSNSLTEDAR